MAITPQVSVPAVCCWTGSAATYDLLILDGQSVDVRNLHPVNLM